MLFFWLSAFPHNKMKAGRGVYDYDVSVTIARPTRSKNWYKKARKRDRVNLIYWEIKLNKARRFFSWYENLMVSSRFLSLWSPEGKLKFLLSFGFIVSLRFYFVYTHWNSACVSIRRKFEICKLILNTSSKKFEFPYLLVLLSFTPHFFCISCSSTRGNIPSEMVCKWTRMYERVNKYKLILLNILLLMDGQIKSKRLCRLLFMTEICCGPIATNISRTHGGW